MVYDSIHREIVLFGGVRITTVGGAPLEVYLNDTWSYRSTGPGNGEWTRGADLILGSGDFSGRAGHAMAFDPQRGFIVMSGGTRGDNSTGDQLANGFPPTKRSRGIYRGGMPGWGPFADAHVDLGEPPHSPEWAGTFTRHTMAYDSARGVVVQASGTAYFSQPQSNPDWWDSEFPQIIAIPPRYDAFSTFKAIGTLSRGRQQFAMVYDQQRNCFVVLGGVASAQYLPVGNTRAPGENRSVRRECQLSLDAAFCLDE